MPIGMMLVNGTDQMRCTSSYTDVQCLNYSINTSYKNDIIRNAKTEARHVIDRKILEPSRISMLLIVEVHLSVIETMEETRSFVIHVGDESS